jgi:hypothetical protein
MTEALAVLLPLQDGTGQGLAGVQSALTLIHQGVMIIADISRLRN